MRINLARLNHVLIPKSKEGRDKWRKSLLGRVSRPLVAIYEGLSEEGRAFALVAIFAAAFGFEVRATEAYLLWSGLVAVVLASFVSARLLTLDRVRVAVVAPKRVTVGEPLTFSVVLTNDADRAHGAVRVRGPFLPWDGSWSHASGTIASLAPGETRRVDLVARFVERGEHHLDPFRAAALAPFGLAMSPPKRSIGSRFLVVPKIANVLSVALPIGKRLQPGGVALASKTGESMELLGVRPYRPGDLARDLHARTWAKRGVPAVREYQQEYFSRVGVILDTDREAIDDAKRLEAAISLASGIVAHLSRGEALIDLLVVGSRVHTLMLGRSLGNFEQALDLLACVEPGPAFDAEALMVKLDPYLARLSCVVFVALSWDRARASFVAQVAASQVACRSFVVGGTGGAEAHRVSVESIERGEALSL